MSQEVTLKLENSIKNIKGKTSKLFLIVQDRYMLNFVTKPAMNLSYIQ